MKTTIHSPQSLYGHRCEEAVQRVTQPGKMLRTYVAVYRLVPLIACMLTFVVLAADAPFDHLPLGCKVTRTVPIDKQETAAIGKRLGVSLKSLSNTFLSMNGKHIRVNILEAGSDADAVKLHRKIGGTKNHPAFCLLCGRQVIEFCDADVATAVKTTYELGFKPKPEKQRYRIEAYVAPIDRADYMAGNPLFNVFLKTDTRNPSKASVAQIKKLSQGFTFGSTLVLRLQPEGRGVYQLTPEPSKSEHLAHDQVKYTFDKPPQVLGVPYITLKAEVVCNATGLSPGDHKSDPALLAATPWWPVDDPEIQALAAKIIVGCKHDEAKVQAILAWLTPNRNIRYAGPSGSRWGVKKVLKQRYGHCWDFSDCFITLARAVGVPCRQVGGWLYGMSGHIWAEVLIAGKGWQQVDPTGGGKLKCGIYHIPYFITEDGEMPILYLAMPRIEVVE